MEKEIPLMERIRKEKTERKKQVISEFESKARPLWKLQEKLLNKIKPLLEERDTQLSELDDFIKKEFAKKYKEIVGYLFHCFENQPDGYIMKWLEDFVNCLSSEVEKKEVLLVLWKLKHA